MSERPSSIEAGARAPGYARAPNHRVAFIPSGKKVRVRVGDETIAESSDVVIVEEGNYPPRYYLARKDIQANKLAKVDGKVTFCPFKGLASYYSLRTGSGEIVEAAWSYEQPYLEGELLRDRICFDRDKVEELAS